MHRDGVFVEASLGEPGFEMPGDDSVKRCLLGAAAGVPRGQPVRRAWLWIDGRRRIRRQPGQPFEPKYRQIAAEVDRQRKAGKGFDRLARELRVSRGTVLRAYDFANRDEAAAAAGEGRKPTRSRAAALYCGGLEPCRRQAERG